MAFSNMFAVCNRILDHAGEDQIPDTTSFNAEGASLSRTQLQCKRFVDLVNRRLGRNVRIRQMKRKGTITTAAWNGSNNTYSLPNGVMVEDLVPETFFITTTGKAGELRHIPYEKWLQIFPQGESADGRPCQWYDLLPDGTDVDKIAFSPPPDNVYTIQYEYYLVPGPISQASDYVFLDTRHEDILWHYGQMWLEVSKAEGKASDFAQIINDLIAQLKQEGYGSAENPPGITLGFKIPCLKKYRGDFRGYSPQL